MAYLDPTNTTPLDIVGAALVESGAAGQGLTIGTIDTNDALARLAWMLQQWQRKRYLVYQLIDVECVMTGKLSYSVGPGGDFDTGVGSVRPANVASAFLRQYPLAASGPTQGGDGIGIDFAIGESPIGPYTVNAPQIVVPFNGRLPIDYPLEVLKSLEDYNSIRLKLLNSQTLVVYYQASWGLGTLYPWPVPQGGSIYSIVIAVLMQLPQNFATPASQAQAFSIPYEYYFAMVYNLALLLRGKYRIPSYQGDLLPMMARDSLETIRAVNFQIATLRMPQAIRGRGSRYNIFGDYST